MISSERPNHTGISVGRVSKINGPDVTVRLEKDVYKQDVLEVRGPDVELTSGSSVKAGDELKLKGREIRKIKPGMNVYRTRNNHLLDYIEDYLIKKERKVPVKVRITAKAGVPLRITVSDIDENICVTAEGQITETAASSPTTAEQLSQKMKKTAGTGLDPLVFCDIDDNVFIPMSSFNDLRRKAVEDFRQEKADQYHRT